MPAERFDTDAVNRITAPLKTVDCHNLHSALNSALQTARSTPHTEEIAPLHLLMGATSIVLRPSDRGAEWGPERTTGAYRTPVPQDFAGDQNVVLAALAPALDHPGLRARLADIAWTNDRRLGAAAALAIESYDACAEQLLDGRCEPSFNFPELALREARDYVERALLLGYVTKRKRVQPDRTVAALRAVYNAARDRQASQVFVESARLALEFGVLDPATIASDAEATADALPLAHYPIAAQAVFDLAAQLHGQVGAEEAKRRCQLKAVDRILAMRNEVSGPGAEAHWVQTALFALRHIRGTEARRRELRRELRDLQEDSLGEMGVMAIPIDLGDERDAILRSFDAMDLPTALREFACLSRSRAIADLRRDARQDLEDGPLLATMGKRYSDADGRTAAHAPGAGPDEEPDEAWYKDTINRHEGFRRHMIVLGRLEPARLSIIGRFAIGEHHVLPIVQLSPFVRWDQVALVSLGFTRLLQGDYRSAVHLLVPQLEPSLRYVLRLAGHDQAVEFDDMTEEDVGLTALLGRLRPLLERQIPADMLLEVELLFHHRPGSALRHAVAHGLIGSDGCSSIDALYACWLLYQLTCAPLLTDWERVVAPYIRA